MIGLEYSALAGQPLATTEGGDDFRYKKSKVICTMTEIQMGK